MRRFIFPVLFGLIGCGLLVGLGVWQLQRLQWKQGILAEITARIGAPPVALPAQPDPVRDDYLDVTVTGRMLDQEVDVLTSRGAGEGPGYYIISPFETADGRRILVDRGFLQEDRKDKPRPAFDTTVVGNLHWPHEVDSYTPAPDLKAEHLVRPRRAAHGRVAKERAGDDHRAPC